MNRELLQRAEEEVTVESYALDGGGRVVLDRSLPFLLVHRAPADRADDGTARLITGEACYLLGTAAHGAEARDHVRRIAESGAEAHGAFLVIELWSAVDTAATRLTVHAPAGPAPETSSKLAAALATLRELVPGLDVVMHAGDVRHPPGMPPLLTVRESWAREILVLGIEVPPVYRDATTGAIYPRFLLRFRRAFSRALRQAIYEFVRVQTTSDVTHPLALGRRVLPDAARAVDAELCALEHGFDMLLLTAPVNGEEAWQRFRAVRHDEEPVFHYRLLPVDPDLLKRRLYALRIENIDDPALADLFRAKREELDTQLTMLGERDTPAFRHGSHRLYGTVSDELHTTAVDLLATVQPRRGPAAARTVDAEAFRAAALRELAHYRAQHPVLDRRVDVRPDVTGLLVSEGNLLIGESLQLDPARVEPLLHHEVGTHVLTYVNGRAQPLGQLSLGLAGYDELQEGLAVFAEYLAGGLDVLRMRLLAARVIAARSVEDGAGFVDTFRVLAREHGYSAYGAWHIALRVHQSGGFTRDFIYLRGLRALLQLLEAGASLESLYLGKIAVKHIPITDELRHRGILRAPVLRPRVLDDPAARARLDAARHGIQLTELICPAAS